MKILLINTNPVVSRLVSLCTRDESITYEEVEHVTEADDSVYDIVFVDDASYNDKVAAFSGWVAQVGKLVFLSGHDSGEEIGGKFDLVIKKPFLPSQIQAVIDQFKEEAANSEKAEEEEPLHLGMDITEEQLPEEALDDTADMEEETVTEHFIFPLSEPESSNGEKSVDEESEKAEDKDEEPSPPKVLDGNEIEQIKALLEEEDEEVVLIDPANEEAYEARKVEVITQKLEEDGLEIVEEEEIISELSQQIKKKKEKSKKSKKNKKKKKTEDIYTMEEALLAAIENMKPKKIKKLLKGAEVTIKIRFKEDV